MSISNFRTGKKKNKKPKRYANKGHLSWVHQFDCSLKVNGDCLGVIQAHHLLRPWDGVRGMGLKASDRNLIPLCQRHHIMLHKRGDEIKYFEEITGNGDFGKIIAQQYWERSPNNDDGEK